MRIRTRLALSDHGFTLIEMMMAIALFGFALTAIYGVLSSVRRSSTLNSVNSEVMQSLRTSLDFMEQDIRLAGLDRYETAEAGISLEAGVSPTQTCLRFTADRNMDGTIGTADLSDGIQESDLETITYWYDPVDRKLRQCLSASTTVNCDTVAEDVQGFAFSYFDSDDNPIAFPIADPTQITTVAVTMTITKPVSVFGTVSRSLTRRILCRNLTM
jgi:prepilin-type N-terminal cleavage/methylation domain-containing protein